MASFHVRAPAHGRTPAERFEEHILSGDYVHAVKLLDAAAADFSALSLTADMNAAAKMQVARLLDAQRALCACVRDACDFSVSFEKSFAHREALLNADGQLGSATASSAGVWAVASLRATLFSPDNVKAAAAALRRLGSSLEGRNLLGRAGAVAALLEAWRKYPLYVDVVDALVVLCSGHVDNVSRFVREDGLEICMKICRSAKVEEGVKEKVLLLLGLCCVCLPDEGGEETLVRVVVECTRTTLQLGKKSAVKGLVANALGVLANVGETVARENYMCRSSGETPLQGYAVHEPQQVVDVVVTAWEKWPADWYIVSPAAWALVAMTRAKQIDLASYPEHLRRIRSLVHSPRVQSSSARALATILESFNSNSACSAAGRKGRKRAGGSISTPPPAKKRSARRTLITSPVSAKDDCDSDANSTDISLKPSSENSHVDERQDGDSEEEDFSRPLSGRRQKRASPRTQRPDPPCSPVTMRRRSSRPRNPARYADGSVVQCDGAKGRKLADI